jgi:hypothetical protein
MYETAKGDRRLLKTGLRVTEKKVSILLIAALVIWFHLIFFLPYSSTYPYNSLSFHPVISRFANSFCRESSVLYILLGVNGEFF